MDTMINCLVIGVMIGFAISMLRSGRRIDAARKQHQMMCNQQVYLDNLRMRIDINDAVHSYRVAVALGDQVTADQWQVEFEEMGMWPLPDE